MSVVKQYVSFVVENSKKFFSIDTYISVIRLPKVLCASCKRNVYQQTAEEEIDD